MRALAEVRESFEQFGTTDADGTLPKKLAICGVMGDSQASLFAQGCYERGDCQGDVRLRHFRVAEHGRSIPDVRTGAVSALAWVWQGRPTYALEGIINYSSATIAWLKDQLGLIDDASETAGLAQAVPDNGGVYLVPAFAGLSAPYWQPNARAAIVGMTAFTKTRAHRSGRTGVDCVSDSRCAGDDAIGRRTLHRNDSMRMAARHAMNSSCNSRPTSCVTKLIVADVAESSRAGRRWPQCLGKASSDRLRNWRRCRVRCDEYGPKMDAAVARAALCRLADGGEAGALIWRTSGSLPNTLSRRRSHCRRRPSRWPASNRPARSPAYQAKPMSCASDSPRASSRSKRWSRATQPSLPGAAKPQAADGTYQRGRVRISFPLGEHRAQSADDHFDRCRQLIRASAAFRSATVGPGISRVAGRSFSRATVRCRRHAPTYRRRTIDRSSARSSSRASVCRRSKPRNSSKRSARLASISSRMMS